MRAIHPRPVCVLSKRWISSPAVRMSGPFLQEIVSNFQSNLANAVVLLSSVMYGSFAMDRRHLEKTLFVVS